MFLYDMLNDKHENIKTTVSQIEKTVKEAETAGGQEAAQDMPLEETDAPHVLFLLFLHPSLSRFFLT